MNVSMRRIALAAGLAFAAALPAAGRAPAAVGHGEIEKAAETLRERPRDAEAWKTFREAARSDAVPADIRARVEFLYALTYLGQMRTNQFADAVRDMRESFPEEGAALAKRIAPEDWLAPCKECGGTGRRPAPGSSDASARCLTCSGTGRIVQIGKRVPEEFRALLKEIGQIAKTNREVAEATADAFAQRNTERRIEAFRALAAAHPGREDLADARKELARLEAEAKKKAEEERARKERNERRERERKGFEDISNAAEGVTMAATPALVKEIDGYLAAYPKSPYRLELEMKKANLLHRRAVYAMIWKVM